MIPVQYEQLSSSKSVLGPARALVDTRKAYFEKSRQIRTRDFTEHVALREALLKLKSKKLGRTLANARRIAERTNHISKKQHSHPEGFLVDLELRESTHDLALANAIGLL